LPVAQVAPAAEHIVAGGPFSAFDPLFGARYNSGLGRIRNFCVLLNRRVAGAAALYCARCPLT